MAKLKRKLSKEHKRRRRAAKLERSKKYDWIFINGKQVKVRKPELIDGISVDEYVRQNADVLWLHQNEMWEEIHQIELDQNSLDIDECLDGEIPF